MDQKCRQRRGCVVLGFPAEDAPFDDYAMMPMPYESAPEPTFRRDTDTGAMTEMPGLRAGDGRMVESW